MSRAKYIVTATCNRAERLERAKSFSRFSTGMSVRDRWQMAKTMRWQFTNRREAGSFAASCRRAPNGFLDVTVSEQQ